MPVGHLLQEPKGCSHGATNNGRARHAGMLKPGKAWQMTVWLNPAHLPPDRVGSRDFQSLVFWPHLTPLSYIYPVPPPIPQYWFAFPFASNSSEFEHQFYKRRLLTWTPLLLLLDILKKKYPIAESITRVGFHSPVDVYFHTWHKQWVT